MKTILMLLASAWMTAIANAAELQHDHVNDYALVVYYPWFTLEDGKARADTGKMHIIHRHLDLAWCIEIMNSYEPENVDNFPACTLEKVVIVSLGVV